METIFSMLWGFIFGAIGMLALKGLISYRQKNKIKKLIEENREYREAIHWFVYRCEMGEVKSIKTYNRYKELLRKYGK